MHLAERKDGDPTFWNDLASKATVACVSASEMIIAIKKHEEARK